MRKGQPAPAVPLPKPNIKSIAQNGTPTKSTNPLRPNSAKQQPIKPSSIQSSSKLPPNQVPLSLATTQKSQSSTKPRPQSSITSKSLLKSDQNGDIEQQQQDRQSDLVEACMASEVILSMNQCQITDIDANTIGVYLSDIHNGFEVINMSKNNLSDTGILSLLIGIQSQSNLKELYLNDNKMLLGIAMQGLATILPVLTSLEILGLGGIGMEDSDVIQLCFGIAELSSLTHLQVHRNNITDIGLLSLIACCLSSAPPPSSLSSGQSGCCLETLYLGQNKLITEEGLTQLFEALTAVYSISSGLKCLHLNDIIMSDRALTSLGKCLSENTRIEELNLSNCGIDPEGFKLCIHAFGNPSSRLKNVYLSSNYLEGESLRLLVKEIQKLNDLKRWSALEVVLVSDNCLKDTNENDRNAIVSLMKELQENKQRNSKEQLQLEQSQKVNESKQKEAGTQKEKLQQLRFESDHTKISSPQIQQQNTISTNKQTLSSFQNPLNPNDHHSRNQYNDQHQLNKYNLEISDEGDDGNDEWSEDEDDDDDDILSAVISMGYSSQRGRSNQFNINQQTNGKEKEEESEEEEDDDYGEAEFLRLEKQIEEDQEIILRESFVNPSAQKSDPIEAVTKKWQGFMNDKQPSNGFLKSRLV